MSNIVCLNEGHSSGICGLVRIPHRDVIFDGRRFFYRFASRTLRGFFDWHAGSSGLRLRRFGGWFFWHDFPE
jgi:hypothetical protein